MARILMILISIHQIFFVKSAPPSAPPIPRGPPGSDSERPIQRPSLGALQPPIQEQTGTDGNQPGTFPNSPATERRNPPIELNSQGPEQAPFNVEGSIFEGRVLQNPNQPSRRGPITNNIEESIPLPPSEDSSQVRDDNENSNSIGQFPQNRANPAPVDSGLRSQGGRGPIMPVRPPPRRTGQESAGMGNGQNRNISEAEAAGLINGEDLNASQEGRCVVCGPRNQFSAVDPVAAQTASPNQRPPVSYEDETEVQPFTRVPPRHPEVLPKELFPNPEDLRLGDLAEPAITSIIRTCRTKLDCKVEPFGARRKFHDIHRSELETQRRYEPHLSPSAVARRLEKVAEVKKYILNAAGLANDVLPPNDGAFQQDILLTEDQAEYLLHKLRLPLRRHRGKRAAVYFEQMPAQQWELGRPIPYTFDASMDARDRRMIQLALRAIETSTCIRFVEYLARPSINHLFYVKIATPTFCGLSYIGKISPANPIYLSFACGDPIGVAIHETMHSLGVAHEHLRVDRDKYLEIDWNNINPQYLDYFAIGDPLAFTSYGVPFDFESIMMYGPYTGSIDPNKPSIKPLNDDGIKFTKMGQRKQLSRSDILLLNRMYCRPQNCVDRNVFCGTWALRGLCLGAPQSTWMQRHCRKSCNFC